jgi:hypothetical protein
MISRLAMVTPPGRKPVPIVCYIQGGPGKIIAEHFA